MTDLSRGASEPARRPQAGLAAADGVAGAGHRGQFGAGVHQPGRAAQAGRHPVAVGGRGRGLRVRDLPPAERPRPGQGPRPEVRLRPATRPRDLGTARVRAVGRVASASRAGLGDARPGRRRGGRPCEPNWPRCARNLEILLRRRPRPPPRARDDERAPATATGPATPSRDAAPHRAGSRAAGSRRSPRHEAGGGTAENPIIDVPRGAAGPAEPRRRRHRTAVRPRRRRAAGSAERPALPGDGLPRLAAGDRRRTAERPPAAEPRRSRRRPPPQPEPAARTARSRWPSRPGRGGRRPAAGAVAAARRAGQQLGRRPTAGRAAGGRRRVRLGRQALDGRAGVSLDRTAAATGAGMQPPPEPPGRGPATPWWHRGTTSRRRPCDPPPPQPQRPAPRRGGRRPRSTRARPVSTPAVSPSPTCWPGCRSNAHRRRRPSPPARGLSRAGCDPG